MADEQDRDRLLERVVQLYAQDGMSSLLAALSDIVFDRPENNGLGDEAMSEIIGKASSKATELERKRRGRA